MTINIRLPLSCFLLAAALTSGVLGQTSAERIDLSTGRASLAGTLSNGRLKNYVFTASKGQTVTIKNASSSIFDFRVFNDLYFDEGDFDSSPSYSFEVPETADYLITVRKKIAGPRSARYSLVIVVK